MQVLDKSNNFQKLSKIKCEDQLVLGSLFVRQQMTALDKKQR